MSFKYGYMAHRSAFSLTPSERQESFQRKKKEQICLTMQPTPASRKFLASRDVR
jgi:hypothetical protein